MEWLLVARKADVRGFGIFPLSQLLDRNEEPRKMKVSIAPAQGCALEDGKPRGVQRLS